MNALLAHSHLFAVFFNSICSVLQPFQCNNHCKNTAVTGVTACQHSTCGGESSVVLVTWVHLRSDWSQGGGSVCCAAVHLIALKTHGGAKRPGREGRKRGRGEEGGGFMLVTLWRSYCFFKAQIHQLLGQSPNPEAVDVTAYQKTLLGVCVCAFCLHPMGSITPTAPAEAGSHTQHCTTHTAVD